jgi:myo-inositol-1(or 4)-monophosphatase
MDFKKAIEKTLEESSKILREQFGKSLKIKEKESHVHIVTEADLASEQRIVSYLEKAFPTHNILSEELGFSGKNSGYTWVIDPLDGTSNFAAGLPWFGPMIALLDGNTPIATYLAEVRQGAFRNGTKISVTKEEELKHMLISFNLDASSLARSERAGDFFGKVVEEVRNMRATNSVYDLGAVADGRLGACILHHARIWDVVAPTLLIQEAGGVCTSLDGSPLKFEVTEDGINRNYEFLGGGRAACKRLIDIRNSLRH